MALTIREQMAYPPMAVGQPAWARVTTDLTPSASVQNLRLLVTVTLSTAGSAVIAMRLPFNSLKSAVIRLDTIARAYLRRTEFYDGSTGTGWSVHEAGTDSVFQVNTVSSHIQLNWTAMEQYEDGNNATQTGVAVSGGLKFMIGDYDMELPATKDTRYLYDYDMSIGADPGPLTLAPEGETTQFLSKPAHRMYMAQEDWATVAVYASIATPACSGFWVGAYVGATLYQQGLLVDDDSVSSMDEFLRIYGIGPQNLMAQDTLTALATYLAANTWDRIELLPVDITAGTPTSSDVTGKGIVIHRQDRYCSGEAVRLAWLNKLGGYDYATFDRRVDRTYSTKRETWEADVDNWSIGDATVNHAVIRRGAKESLSTKTTERYTATTEITEDWMDYYAQLVRSTYVVMLTEQGGRMEPIPVIVTTADFKRMKVRDERKPLLLTIEFERAYPFKSTAVGGHEYGVGPLVP